LVSRTRLWLLKIDAPCQSLKKRLTSRELWINVGVLATGLSISLWLYRGLLPALGTSASHLPPFSILSWANLVSYPWTVLYWALIYTLDLPSTSQFIIPQLFLGVIEFWSFFYFMRKILGILSRDESASAMYIASLVGALSYRFGIESFANWGGMATAQALLPLYGAAVLGALTARKRLASVPLFIISFLVYALAFYGYPVFFVLSLTPLFVVLVALRLSDEWGSKALMSAASLVAAELAYGVYQIWTSPHVGDPESWSNSITANYIFLNSGSRLIYLFAGSVNPAITSALPKYGYFPLLFVVPAIAFASLLVREKRVAALSRTLAAFSLAVIALYSLDFLSLPGPGFTIALRIAFLVPWNTARALLVPAITEYRIPQFLLSFSYSVLVALSAFSALRIFRGLRRAALASLILSLVVLGCAGSYGAYLGFTNLPSAPISAGSLAAYAPYLNALNYIYEHQSGYSLVLPVPQINEFTGIMVPIKNLIYYPWGSDGPSSTWYLSFTVGQDYRVGLLAESNYQQASAFLADVGVNYLVLYGNYYALAKPLVGSGYFIPVFSEDNVTVLRNLLYRPQWTSHEILYVDGGLQTYSSFMPFEALLGYNYTNPVPFYLDRYPLPNTAEYPGTYLFSQLWNVYDLAVPFLNASVALPIDYCNNTGPPWQAWQAAAVTQVGFPWSFWTNYEGYLNQFTYQFRYGLAYTVNLKVPQQKPLTLSLRAPSSGDYYLLIRYYVADQHAPLRVTVDDNQSYELSQYSGSYVGGFVWTALPVKLRAGLNTIEFRSGGGVSAVNLVELASPGELEAAVAKAESLINASPYFYLAYMVNGSQELSLPLPSVYRVYSYIPEGAGELTLSANGSTISFRLQAGVHYLGEMYLPVSFNVSSIGVAKGSALLLERATNSSLQGNYTVLVVPSLYYYTWNKFLSLGGKRYAPYPAYGESTAYILQGDALEGLRGQ
jgi:hypothetical protein